MYYSIFSFKYEKLIFIEYQERCLYELATIAFIWNAFIVLKLNKLRRRQNYLFRKTTKYFKKLKRSSETKALKNFQIYEC